MEPIIWINGTINSGKSTLAKILAKKTKRAVIELDSFYEMLKDCMELPDIFAFNHDAIFDIVEVFTKRGINVIVVYPISRKQVDAVLEKMPDAMFVTLDPGIEVVMQQRGERVLSEWEIQRIQALYDKGINDIGVGVRITNEGFTADEVVEKIIDCYHTEIHCEK